MLLFERVVPDNMAFRIDAIGLRLAPVMRLEITTFVSTMNTVGASLLGAASLFVGASLLAIRASVGTIT